MRYFIEIAYNGTSYFGWQMQPDAISVQEELEKALSTLLRKDLKVIGAGRTDTGVHARQLYAHFDFDTIEDASELTFRLNSFLPKDISVRNILAVREDAHARFHATERSYEYIISTQKDPFSEGLAHQLHRRPNVALMNEAANELLSHQNFQCFSRSNTDVKTYNCKVTKAIWEENGNRLSFTITSDRFLRNMVRAVVGTLLDVGFGKTTFVDFLEILKSKDRTKAGASAPAHGLYLMEVGYPKDIFIVK
ncbi:tRNA pseudouridine(38-40) synthase TruA [Ulvibacter antarcticus]|uniref:tRNA pseudouridine synthase A n=1 Tax=Ulvibacter antarcticus TaxID=442714 RepID=A0A3L9YFD7_9FLAO|nr:tRNA pseudouridine(38-40) synthase TruA [Ulvibacter antarcticus]RMA57839.1 tRNA pseudouridine38-40 synthase [Ulvibacter antarcticus]